MNTAAPYTLCSRSSIISTIYTESEMYALGLYLGEPKFRRIFGLVYRGSILEGAYISRAYTRDFIVY